MKKVKILFVLNSVGGVDIYAQLLLSMINTDLFEIIIVHDKNTSSNTYKDKNNQIYKSYSIPVIREIKPINDIKCTLQLIKIIKKEQPDFIHAHSAKAGVISRLAGKLCSIKILYTPHAFSYLSSKKPIKRYLYIFIEKFLKYFNSYIVATSNSEATRAIKEIKYNPSKVFVWKNSIIPINKESLSFNNKLPENFICTIGRPSYQKNLEDLILVFEKVKQSTPDLKLIIMGIGFYSPKQKELMNLIQEKSLEDSIITLNWMNRNDIFEILTQSKLYVSTSRYEGLPYSIIECLAIGKACVVSACDGNIDLIIDSFNGYVVPLANLIKDMPEKIIELLKDKNKREQFENNALNLFNEQYDINKNINKIEKIYLNFKKS